MGNKRSWIVSMSAEPQAVIVEKKTKKMSAGFYDDSWKHRFRVANDDIFESYEECLKQCIKKNYKSLSVYSKRCADMMDKIKKQEIQLDAERTK